MLGLLPHPLISIGHSVQNSEEVLRSVFSCEHTVFLWLEVLTTQGSHSQLCCMFPEQGSSIFVLNAQMSDWCMGSGGWTYMHASIPVMVTALTCSQTIMPEWSSEYVQNNNLNLSTPKINAYIGKCRNAGLQPMRVYNHHKHFICLFAHYFLTRKSWSEQSLKHWHTGPLLCGMEWRKLFCSPQPPTGLHLVVSV